MVAPKSEKNDVNARLLRGELRDERLGAYDLRGGWQEPEPLMGAPVEMPPFPTHALPHWIEAHALEVAEATQTDPAAASLLGLAVLAASCAKRVRVRCSPTWTEGLNLYCAVAMGSGEGKTPVFHAMTAPIRSWEREQRKLAEEPVRTAKRQRKILERRLEHWMAQASSVKLSPIEREEAMREAAALDTELARHVIPSAADVLASNVTSEKLKSLLADNEGRMAVMTDEGNQIFANMTGLYNKGQANAEVYTEGYNSPRILVHRMGRDPDDVPHPALTLAIAIQPEVMQGTAGRRELRYLGVLARFLWAIPVSRVGSRNLMQESRPYGWKRNYAQAMHAMLNLPVDPNANDDDRWRTVDLSPAAYGALTGFRQELEAKLGPYGELHEVKDLVLKVPGQVARLAGLLHLADRAGEFEPWAEDVQIETMERALEIGRWSLPNTLQAMGLTTDAADESYRERMEAQRVLTWIGQQDVDWIKERVIFDNVKRRGWTVEDNLRPLLRLLERRGYLRRVKESAGAKGGRPLVRFEINPLWVAGRPAA